MRLSVLAHAVSADLKLAAERSRQLGFDGIVIDPQTLPAVTEPSRTAQREIVHLLSRAGQSLVAIDIRLHTAGLSPDRRRGGDVDREIERVGRAIDVARNLSASLVLCDLGPLPPAPGETPILKPVIDPAALGRLILPDPTPSTAPAAAPAVPRDEPFEAAADHALRAIGERADRAGCMIAFRASLGSMASLHVALKRADCPFFGIDLDPLALLADPWTIDDVFSRVGPLVQHVRARDGLRGATGRVVAAELGSGHVDWQSLIAALRDSDYRGSITLDPNELTTRSGDLAGRAIQRLRGWLA